VELAETHTHTPVSKISGKIMINVILSVTSCVITVQYLDSCIHCKDWSSIFPKH
jgi:hypothetical protein